MAIDVTKLTSREVLQRNAEIAQEFEAYGNYFTGKPPVADLTALAAVVSPTEGEERVISDDLPALSKYMYWSGNPSPQVVPDDGSPGGWFKVELGGTGGGGMWKANTFYEAGTIFNFVAPADGVDGMGNEIRKDTLYGGVYMDNTLTAQPFTSGPTVGGDYGKIVIEDGRVLDQELTQAEYDALYPV